MQTIRILYLVSPNAQPDEVEKFCFGQCGKIIIGNVKMFGGNFLACNINQCEHSEKEEKFVEFDVIVRKLKSIDQEGKAVEMPEVT